MEYQEKQTKDRPEIKTLEKEKKQTETALHNVMAAIEQGIVSNTTAARLQELESKLEEIDKRLLIHIHPFQSRGKGVLQNSAGT